MRSIRCRDGASRRCLRPTRRSRSGSGACARSTMAATPSASSPLPHNGPHIGESAAGISQPRHTPSMTGGPDDLDRPHVDAAQTDVDAAQTDADAAQTDVDADKKLSDQLEEWLTGEGDRTLGALVDAFGDKSFAIIFVVLLGIPALPLPTGGATHVFEIIAALLALELIIGRRQVWLPERWQRLKLGGDKQQKFITGLTRLIRRLVG